MRRDVVGRHVANSDALEQPGDFCWGVHNDDDPTIVSLDFLCPNCGAWHAVPVKPGHGTGWNWNGDREKPTLSPSMLFSGGHSRSGNQERRDCRWHGWMRDGVWVSA